MRSLATTVASAGFVAGAFILLPATLSAQLGQADGVAGSDFVTGTGLSAEVSEALETGYAAPSPEPPVSGSPDFLFRRPGVTLSVRGGMFFNRARGDVFDHTIRHLTVERSDFRGGSGALDFGIWMGDRLEMVFSGELGEVTQRSESRDFVEENGDPIVQATRLRQGPGLTGGVKFFLLPRGESISRFAWTPRALNTFVGGGFGWTSYEFRQWGDFVDEVNLTISTLEMIDDGGTFFPYASGGVEYTLSNRISLLGEARYLWATGDAGGDFFHFDHLDLSGLRLTAGLGFRF